MTVTFPGQENPQHYDIGDLFGIGTQQFPAWLLIAMNNSGLFEDMRISTIQGVTYLHQWNNTQEINYGGQLRIWEYGSGHEYQDIEAFQKRVVLFDGTKIAHQTVLYQQNKKPQFFDKNMGYVAFYNEGNWDIYDQKSGKLYISMPDKDTRLTIVWRQKCFKNKQLADEHEQIKNNGGSVKINEIIDKMINNLLENNVINENYIPQTEIDKAEIIIDNYIEYSFDQNKWFPYNLCIILEFTIPRYLLKYIGFQFIC